MRVYVALSKLRPGKQNPRCVKPGAEAQQRLVASIRAFGLLEPLVVRPMPEADGEFQVIAGNRRLVALRQIHRNSKDDPKISCEVKNVDDPTAGAMSLSENFVREAMHPLDEAEAFAKLATDEAKGVEAIAASFGVKIHFVKQRMVLAGLSDVVKSAFRRNDIDIATAEAFAAVPEDRQLAIWKETGGKPHHAQHVWNIIAAAWIDAGKAMFDLSTLPDTAISRDLFNDQVLIERTVFMEAQREALAKQQEALKEEGWAEVVIGPHAEVQDRLYAMRTAESVLDAKTVRKLSKLEVRRQKLETKLRDIGEDDEDALQAIQERGEHLNVLARQLVNAAPKTFGEATKATGTVFLILNPDGQVGSEYRVPRPARGDAANSHNGSSGDSQNGPTADDLSDRQLADTFTHQVLAIRAALLKAPASRNRLLAMILHDRVHSEALAVRRDVNGVNVHAAREDGLASPILEKLKDQRTKLDPFAEEHFAEDCAAYARLAELSTSKLGQLIECLLVDCVTAHLQRRTALVHQLAIELKVDVRQSWCPDSAWLARYQKIQLAGLMAELRGPIYDPTRETRKKSELVEALATLFADSNADKLEDKALAERVNAWLPLNLREVVPPHPVTQ